MSRADKTSLLQCRVCSRETDGIETAYCADHTRTLDSLRRAFRAWSIGYGKLTVPDFLEKIEKLPETGAWAKEMARFLLNNPSRWD